MVLKLMVWFGNSGNHGWAPIILFASPQLSKKTKLQTLHIKIELLNTSVERGLENCVSMGQTCK